MQLLNEPADIGPCTGCGGCCMAVGSPPYREADRAQLQREHPEAFAELLEVERTRAMQLAINETEPARCGFLDPVTRGCRWYDQRPDVCRRFEIGNATCQQARAACGLPLIPLDTTIPHAEPRPWN